MVGVSAGCVVCSGRCGSSFVAGTSDDVSDESSKGSSDEDAGGWNGCVVGDAAEKGELCGTAGKGGGDGVRIVAMGAIYSVGIGEVGVREWLWEVDYNDIRWWSFGERERERETDKVDKEWFRP